MWVAFAKATHIFFCKNISVNAIFNDQSFNNMLTNYISFEQLGTGWWYVCIEVLRPSQPNGVMSSAVSLPNHMITGQALSSKRLTSIVHILLPETDNCPSWISVRKENDHRKYLMINLHERMLPTSAGVEPETSWSPVVCASNWATKAWMQISRYTGYIW